MLAIEVWINGEKKCVAGTNDNVLSGIVNVMSPPEIHVGGLMKKSGNTFHARWLNQPLEVGDEVRIRLIETDEVDEPQIETRAYPEAEGDYDMRSRLLNLRALLSTGTQENVHADLTLFDEKLEQQDFATSMRILAKVGEANTVSASYWRGLSWIATLLGQHEEAKQYIARENALPPQDEESQ